MTLAYAHEQLSEAIYTLAVSPGEIKSRLMAAYSNHLSSIKPDRDLPEGLRDEFRQLLGRFTTRTPQTRNETRVQATFYGRRRTVAVEIAKDVVAFAYQVRNCLQEERRKP